MTTLAPTPTTTAQPIKYEGYGLDLLAHSADTESFIEKFNKASAVDPMTILTCARIAVSNGRVGIAEFLFENGATTEMFLRSYLTHCVIRWCSPVEHERDPGLEERGRAMMTFLIERVGFDVNGVLQNGVPSVTGLTLAENLGLEGVNREREFLESFGVDCDALDQERIAKRKAEGKKAMDDLEAKFHEKTASQ